MSVDPEAMTVYLDQMDTLIFIDGVLNAVCFLVCLVYIIAALIKKTKLSNFTWLGLYILLGLSALLTYGELLRVEMATDYCNFQTHMLFGVNTIVLIALSILIGYKVYTVCYTICEFAERGNLPTERSKERNHRIIVGIWCMLFILLAVYLTMNCYWWFGSYNLEALRWFNYVAHIWQPILFALAAMIYLLSLRLMYKLRTISASEKNTTIIRNGIVLLWILLASFTFTALSCLWRVIDQGYFNATALASQIAIVVTFKVIKVLLFFILLRWTMDVQLRTQVLASGQVVILFVDQYERDILKFYVAKSVSFS